MCLYIERGQEPQVAEEDTICYKIVRILTGDAGDDFGKIETPYQHTPVSIGETYSSELNVVNDCDCDTIELGLHSIATIEDARKELIDWNGNKNEDDDYKIVKCVIPKNAVYFTGGFKLTYFSNCAIITSYASDSITYVEFLK